MKFGGKNFAIGLFALIAIIILVVSLLSIRPSIGDKKQLLKVRFSTLDRIGIGTRVNFAGRPVGEVSEVHIVDNAREGKLDNLGRLYFYELDLRVDSSVQIYENDEITLSTWGLFGEKSIAIIPRKVSTDEAQAKIANKNTVLYATSTEPFEGLVAQISEVSETLNTTLEGLSSFINKNQSEVGLAVKEIKLSFEQLNSTLVRVNELDLMGSFQESAENFAAAMGQIEKQSMAITDHKLIENISQTVDNIQVISKALNHPQKIDEIITNAHELTTRLADISNKLDGKLPNLEASLDSVVSNFQVAAQNAKEITSHFKQVSEDIAQGKGNLGKLISRDDLYLQAIAILTKVETLMDDLNSYGLLFHNNRSWQKERSKRMAAFDKIKTPEQLITYFEGEVDSISTTLTRMNKAVKGVESQTAQSPEQVDLFKKSFHEVLNKLDHLEEMVKLYNERVYSPSKQANK